MGLFRSKFLNVIFKKSIVLGKRRAKASPAVTHMNLCPSKPSSITASFCPHSDTEAEPREFSFTNYTGI